MPLKPGQKALVGAGRKKGTPNRQTADLMSAIRAACGEDYDPVVGMARVDYYGVMPVRDPQTGAELSLIPIDPALRQKCAQEVAKYIHPQRKAIDLSTPPGEELNVRISNDSQAACTLQSMFGALGELVAEE